MVLPTKRASWSDGHVGEAASVMVAVGGQTSRLAIDNRLGDGTLETAMTLLEPPARMVAGRAVVEDDLVIDERQEVQAGTARAKVGGEGTNVMADKCHSLHLRWTNGSGALLALRPAEDSNFRGQS
ncbi:uncharacterized protein An16g00330 [Aspergillus niger]|uniref:Contig An16c0010, genomic contig n=2 Tax=Aspergillus niger TaxID=5061 RepID=A2R6K5_ASPNC|nr:uncharacterized protein An16g00330 [Aspergillus niger]CAK42713.1 unnamed protein product [Aspergillus niger]